MKIHGVSMFLESAQVHLRSTRAWARLWSASGMLLLLATSASAAPLVAGPFMVDDQYSAGDTLNCLATNIGTKPIEMVVRAVLDDVSTANIVLAPGEISRVYNYNFSSQPAPGYCSFDVKKGGKKNLRATGCVDIGPGVTCGAAVPAL